MVSQIRNPQGAMHPNSKGTESWWLIAKKRTQLARAGQIGQVPNGAPAIPAPPKPDMPGMPD